MPLYSPAHIQCLPSFPCRSSTNPCVRCHAARWLTADEWRVISFYNLVQDQFLNQTPQGVADGPSVLTPNLPGYLAALQIYGYDQSEWSWYTRGAVMLHRLVHKLDVVAWDLEIPRLLGRPNARAFVTDGDLV